jgi:hypothetical protein
MARVYLEKGEQARFLRQVKEKLPQLDRYRRLGAAATADLARCR